MIETMKIYCIEKLITYAAIGLFYALMSVLIAYLPVSVVEGYTEIVVFLGKILSFFCFLIAALYVIKV